MEILNTFKFIWNHPLGRLQRFYAFARWIRWQIGSRILNAPVAMPFVDSCRLISTGGMTGATGNIYVGLHEFNEMSFLLHYLRPGDLFVDVGANIGSYTVLASGAAGANTICFEPMPSTFESLLDNININRLSPIVTSFNVAVGAKSGKTLMVADLDTMNHIIDENNKYTGETVEVDVVAIDEILQDQEMVPRMIKIDVEGFENVVLAGAKCTLECTDLEVILIELNGCGVAYGFDDMVIDEMLTNHGFKLVEYNGISRQLKPIKFGLHKDNAIYVRNIDKVQERVVRSKRYKVAGSTV
jgi:FkbM family methyltransferase